MQINKFWLTILGATLAAQGKAFDFVYEATVVGPNNLPNDLGGAFINNNGTVVYSTGMWQAIHSYQWTGTASAELFLADGSPCKVMAINDVGDRSIARYDPTVANYVFYLQNSAAHGGSEDFVMRVSNGSSGYHYGRVNNLNNSGMMGIFGLHGYPPGGPFVGYTYSYSRDFGLSFVANGSPGRISQSGRLSLTQSGVSYPSVYDASNGSWEDYQAFSEGAITDNGTLYLRSNLGSIRRDSDGTQTTIPALPSGLTKITNGGLTSYGRTINGADTILLLNSNTGENAVLASMLTPTSSGWTFGAAYDINESGQLLVKGTKNGVTNLVLLNPVAVPEPQEFLTLALGLGSVVIRERRRNNALLSSSKKLSCDKMNGETG